MLSVLEPDFTSGEMASIVAARPHEPCQLFEEVSQPLAARCVTQPGQRLGLYLTNAFATDTESLANLFQRPLMAVDKTEKCGPQRSTYMSGEKSRGAPKRQPKKPQTSAVTKAARKEAARNTGRPAPS
jgi:hypothetical protein